MKNVAIDMQRMVDYFNSQDLPYKMEIVTEGISAEQYVVARWKWMDAAYFTGVSVTKEIQEFAVYYKLEPDGKYRYFDSADNLIARAGMADGRRGASVAAEAFYGKRIEYKKTVVLGRNNLNGKEGLVGFVLKSGSIHKPVKEWLEKNGYKKRRTTFKEHINGLRVSVNPVVSTVTGCVFSIVGTVFSTIGATFLVKGLLGDAIELTVTKTVNGIKTTEKIKSATGTMIFGGCFGGIGLIFLIIGIVILCIHLPVYIKMRRLKKQT